MCARVVTVSNLKMKDLKEYRHFGLLVRKFKGHTLFHVRITLRGRYVVKKDGTDGPSFTWDTLNDVRNHIRAHD